MKHVAAIRIGSYKVAILKGEKGLLDACEFERDPTGRAYIDRHSGIRADLFSALLGFVLRKHGIDEGGGDFDVLRVQRKKVGL